MKIICIGRNYRDHVKELNNQVEKEPVIFLKPETAIPPKNHPFFIPDFSTNIHYETELVIRINKLGKNIQENFAHKYYQEIGLGIDFTARDLQEDLKTRGLPWEKAKGFDGSAAISKRYIDKNDLNLKSINFNLQKNGKQVQIGNSKNMIFNINEIIAYISKFYTLKIGDLIFTGTPSGVGQVYKGDLLEGFIENAKILEVRIR